MAAMRPWQAEGRLQRDVHQHYDGVSTRPERGQTFANRGCAYPGRRHSTDYGGMSGAVFETVEGKRFVIVSANMRVDAEDLVRSGRRRRFCRYNRAGVPCRGLDQSRPHVLAGQSCFTTAVDGKVTEPAALVRPRAVDKISPPTDAAAFGPTRGSPARSSASAPLAGRQTGSGFFNRCMRPQVFDGARIRSTSSATQFFEMVRWGRATSGCEPALLGLALCGG